MNIEHMENWMIWNILASWVTLLENSEHRTYGEHGILSSWPGVTFEVSAGEQRAHEEQENVEYIYYLVGLDLKFAIVLENGGEHRAHGELELERGILSNWVTFEVCARERWRTQSTWRTGEHGILSS